MIVKFKNHWSKHIFEN